MEIIFKEYKGVDPEARFTANATGDDVMYKILNALFAMVIVVGIAIVSFVLGANTTFDRCLETNKHLVYSEARKVCGEEQK